MHLQKKYLIFIQQFNSRPKEPALHTTDEEKGISTKNLLTRKLSSDSNLSSKWFSKWFEPKSISSLSCVIVRVSVVLKRTVGDSD